MQFEKWYHKNKWYRKRLDKYHWLAFCANNLWCRSVLFFNSNWSSLHVDVVNFIAQSLWHLLCIHTISGRHYTTWSDTRVQSETSPSSSPSWYQWTKRCQPCGGHHNNEISPSIDPGEWKEITDWWWVWKKIDVVLLFFCLCTLEKKNNSREMLWIFHSTNMTNRITSVKYGIVELMGGKVTGCEGHENSI